LTDATEAQERADALEEAGERIQGLLANARRRIWVHTRCRLLVHLPAIHLARHLSRVARRTRHADLRLLIDDDLALKTADPDLTRTVTRLPTAIQVRCLVPETEVPAMLRLVVDRSAWLFLQQQRSTVALTAATRDPAGTRVAAERFDADWAVGSQALELRALML